MKRVGAFSRALFPIVPKEDEILVFQRSDSNIIQKITILQKPKNERNHCGKSNVNNYILRDDLLYSIMNCVRISEERDI